MHPQEGAGRALPTGRLPTRQHRCLSLPRVLLRAPLDCVVRARSSSSPAHIRGAPDSLLRYSYRHGSDHLDTPGAGRNGAPHPVRRTTSRHGNRTEHTSPARDDATPSAGRLGNPHRGCGAAPRQASSQHPAASTPAPAPAPKDRAYLGAYPAWHSATRKPESKYTRDFRRRWCRQG